MHAHEKKGKERKLEVLISHYEIGIGASDLRYAKSLKTSWIPGLDYGFNISGKNASLYKCLGQPWKPMENGVPEAISRVNHFSCWTIAVDHTHTHWIPVENMENLIFIMQQVQNGENNETWTLHSSTFPRLLTQSSALGLWQLRSKVGSSESAALDSFLWCCPAPKFVSLALLLELQTCISNCLCNICSWVLKRYLILEMTKI